MTSVLRHGSTHAHLTLVSPVWRRV